MIAISIDICDGSIFESEVIGALIIDVTQHTPGLSGTLPCRGLGNRNTELLVFEIDEGTGGVVVDFYVITPFRQLHDRIKEGWIIMGEEMTDSIYG